MKKKLSSRARKNEWNELIPVTKAGQIKFIKAEIRAYIKLLNDIAPVDYCRACGADTPKNK
jgi:hypothetical protein